MMEATTDMQESLLQSAALSVTLGRIPSQARTAGHPVTRLGVTRGLTCSHDTAALVGRFAAASVTLD